MKDIVVLTSIPSDSHTWNLVYLDLFISERGFEVVNLGACTPVELVRRRCREVEPRLVVVSTVNGHGGLQAQELARSLANLPKRDRIELVLGGKLGIHGEVDATRTRALLTAGFDHVFDDSPTMMAAFETVLRSVRVRARRSREAESSLRDGMLSGDQAPPDLPKPFQLPSWR
jgi:methylaspartate mutase sigma subunit